MPTTEESLVLSSDWITLDEAVRILGRSSATVERLAASGRLRSQLQQVPGRKSMRVYSAEDARALAPKEGPVPLRNGAAHETRPLQLQLPPEVLELTRQVMEERQRYLPAPEEPKPAAVEEAAIPLSVPLHRKLWLTLDEAAAYSGLNKTFLIGLIDTRQVRAMKRGPNGSWVILRSELESYYGEL